MSDLNDMLNDKLHSKDNVTDSISNLLKDKAAKSKARKSIDKAFDDLIEANSLLVKNANAKQQEMLNSLESFKSELKEELAEIQNVNALLVKNHNVSIKNFNDKADSLAEKYGSSFANAIDKSLEEISPKVREIEKPRLEQMQKLDAACNKVERLADRLSTNYSRADLLNTLSGKITLFLMIGFVTFNFAFCSAYILKTNMVKLYNESISFWYFIGIDLWWLTVCAIVTIVPISFVLSFNKDVRQYDEENISLPISYFILATILSMIYCYFAS